jgi:cell division protein FtsI (penicillin-binding protein 3)
MGQEVGVTPLQLVSMVSTIANGGVYLPPHIVMAPITGKDGETVAPVAQPFHPGGELPNPLPTGSRRVISTMSAAQMRKMMEGVVLYGTGKQAQLNGYSSGGKTGTAQKIDPATRTYSKTMHVASFAGIAPVNSPVIAVAVVIDNPKGGGASYYGGAVSAPVFAQVAQQTLEYLRVPHDVEVHVAKPGTKPVPGKDIEPEQEHTGDVNALMAAVNDLPGDDPLREAISGARAASENNQVVAKVGKTPAKAPVKQTLIQPKPEPVHTAEPETVSVSLPIGKMVKVPSLMGMPVRQVVEQVAIAGLNLQVVGRGLVRSQEPAAGTEVKPGSQVVVHCAR